ncbi:hypothetical protein ILUMI_12490 [Ignelater luminosus]|uniref:Uncharacterized protein n=1 Tax=Ignelater luminosus TaxID=2038154 RepID=A0A8K0CYG9_IGNLU|nr:hypothetical protein ILUMI_12490 [Ignelater luminosus]
MTSFTLATSLSFLMFCVLIDNVTPLRCYNCSSRENYGECYVTEGLTTGSSIECGTAPCLKLKPIVIGDQSDTIERGCYKEELCTDYSVCYICDDKDYCNSSLKITPSHYIVFLGLIYVYCHLR